MAGATKADVILSVMGVNIGEEMTKEKIAEVFQNFKEAKKIIEDYETNTLKPFLFKSAEQLGRVTDSGGNRVELPDGSGWEKQARVSVTVDEEKALELMEEKNLFEYVETDEYICAEDMEAVISLLKNHNRQDLISTNRTVSHQSLEQAYLQEQITDAELGSIISRKVTYALVEVKPPKKKN